MDEDEDPRSPGIGSRTSDIDIDDVHRAREAPTEAPKPLVAEQRKLLPKEDLAAPLHREKSFDDWQAPQGPLCPLSVSCDSETVLRQASFRAWRWRWLRTPKVLRLVTQPSPIVSEWINKMLDSGCIEECSSRGVAVACRHFPVPKPHDPSSFRVVGDFRPLNAMVAKEDCEYPRIEHLWCEAANVPFVSCVDVQDGFYQVRVPHRYKKYFGIRCNGKWYRYVRLPQGFINAPRIFTSFMQLLLPVDDRIKFYMDDVLGLGIPVHELEAVLRDCGLPVKSEKSSCSLSDSGAIVLGVRIRHEGEKVSFSPSDRTNNAVLKWQSIIRTRAVTKRELYAYAGSLQFVRAFIPNITAHLHSLYVFTADLDWDEELTWVPDVSLDFPFNAVMLWRDPWHLFVDASAEGYGCMFRKGQGTELGISKLRTDSAWKNLVGVYREVCAADWALSKWPSARMMVLHSDSKPMVQALAKQDFSNWNKVYQRKLKRLPKDWVYIEGPSNSADKWSRPLFNAGVVSTVFAKYAKYCGLRNVVRSKN